MDSVTLYLDTSALVKLYHEEAHAEELKSFIQNEVSPSSLIISRLAIVEFHSAVWQKNRIARAQANSGYSATKMLLHFGADLDMGRYTVIEPETQDYEVAKGMLDKCNAAGVKLRTLDALQLAIAFQVKADLDMFVSCDKDQSIAARFLGLSLKHIGSPLSL